jgi:DNA-nicking Smr family endonuclease
MADDISDEDKALFREHMRTVTPLNKKKAADTSAHRVHDKAKPVSTEYFLSDFIPEPVFSHTVLSYRESSLSLARFKALKNGSIRWEAQLDLHGQTTETARAALCQFIPTQISHNKRCVLIIHGKGSHHHENPIIKNLVNRWLPQFPEVLGFHSAKPQDGGQGAVYVLLKKQGTKE